MEKILSKVRKHINHSIEILDYVKTAIKDEKSVKPKGGR
jgi:hypothetical protein